MLWVTAGEMVLSSNLSGKLRKRRDGTTQCRPSSSLILTCRASSQKDRTGRQNVVRPRPGPGRTDCPVENTAFIFMWWDFGLGLLKMVLLPIPSLYFLCSDSFLEHACLLLWRWAEDSGIWFRLWAFGLYIRVSIANAGIRDNFGIRQLSG